MKIVPDSASAATISSFQTVIGGSGNDVLTGDQNDNVIIGGAGDDVIAGLGGADKLDGGADNDTVNYAASSSSVTINLSQQGTGDALTGTAGTPQSGGDAAGDLLWNFENIRGSANNDVLTGDSNDNIIEGSAADSLHGGGGNDTVSYAHSSAGVTVGPRYGRQPRRIERRRRHWGCGRWIHQHHWFGFQ